MPPKRGKKTAAAAPTRRSKRLGSREPSLEQDTVLHQATTPEGSAWDVEVTSTATLRGEREIIYLLTSDQRKEVINMISDRNAGLEQRVSDLERDLERKNSDEGAARPSGGMKKALRLARIDAEIREKKSVSAQTSPAPKPSATPPAAAVVASPPTTPTEIVIQQPQPPPSGWRNMFTTFNGYFGTPFTRKRPAEDVTTTEVPQPAAKRTRTEEHHPTPQTSQPLEAPQDTAVPVSTIPTTTSSASKEQLFTSSPAKRLSQLGSRKRAIVYQQGDTQTPTQAATVPVTTISTISSAMKEPSSTSDSPKSLGPFGSRKRAIEYDEDDTETPTTNKRARTEHTQHTPLTGRDESPRDYVGPSTMNPKMPTSLSTIAEYTEPSFLSSFSESTPSRPPRRQQQRSLLQGTPTIRRAAQLRAARRLQSPTTATPDYSWLPKPEAPKPREPNADARLAKLERMRTLQKELEELQQDADIKEMQSHRRKRVKVDKLASIPHNRPGDSAGTFRVPDVDSDDEIEVMEDVEEMSNVFESEVEMTEITDTTRTAEIVETAEITELCDMEEVTMMPVFEFPDVGPRMESEESAEYMAECGRLFEEGYNAWVAQGMPMEV